MKDKLLKMIAKKEEARQKLAERSEKATTVEELRSINHEIDAINHDIAELRSAVQTLDSGDDRTNTVTTGKPLDDENRDKQKDEQDGETRSKGIDPERGFEKRGGANLDGSQQPEESAEECSRKNGENIREGRSVSVGTGNIVIPTASADHVNGTFLQVSNVVDAVHSTNMPSCESYTVPYEVSTEDGTYTAEGAAATDTDTAFGKADIAKAKITAYSEITEEIEKLPAAPYADIIMNGITRSVRKKLAKEIMVGTGDANTLVGIFSAKATAIDASTDISLAKIDNTTLDDIIYGYGGDESVEGTCVLILNKKDLAAFAKLRNTDGSKFHDIKPSGNGGSGTIDGTPYIINSACGSIADSNTKASTYCMAYGNLTNYELTIFSRLDVQKSKDYKFKEGMTAYRGVVFAGGNVVSHNGFIRVKKAATA